MRYVAAYLLAVLGSKSNPSAADIDKILSSVGIDSDADKVKKVISELSGKNLEDIMKAGQEKLASMPSGGGAVAVAAAAPTAAAGGGGDTKKEAKKEEKKADSESEDDDMGFGLFD